MSHNFLFLFCWDLVFVEIVMILRIRKNIFRTTPTHLEIVITWCYCKPVHIVFPPSKLFQILLNWKISFTFWSLPCAVCNAAVYDPHCCTEWLPFQWNKPEHRPRSPTSCSDSHCHGNHSFKINKKNMRHL